MKNLRSFFLLLLLATGITHAHEDRVLSIQSDGAIPEIPASFGRVSLVIKGLGGENPIVRFRVGALSNDIPACLTSMIRTRRIGDIRISGSWYHDESNLPYYVNVVFPDPGYRQDRLNNPRLELLFNLRTAQLIKVNRLDTGFLGIGGGYGPVKLPKDCKVEITDRILGNSPRKKP